MLKIFICEDHIQYQKHLEKFLNDYIALKDLPMKVSMSTNDPYLLLQHLQENPQQRGIYFLDVNLRRELNGIELAREIRKIDLYGKIIFITAFDELSHLAFRYQVEALDYIAKDSENINTRIQECLETAYDHYLNFAYKECFTVNTGGTLLKIPYDEIAYFETHYKSHRVILNSKNKRIDFNGTLKEIEKKSINFFLCHRSFLINLKHITSFNKSNRLVLMSNGLSIPVSRNKIKGLEKLMIAEKEEWSPH